MIENVLYTKNPTGLAGFSVFGTSGRTRTDTLLRARDFESRVSTNSTTLAFLETESHEAGDYSSDH